MAESYTSRQLNLFIASWNVGNEAPENVDKLLPGWTSSDANYYDLIVIGLQESTYTLSGDDGDANGSRDVRHDANMKKDKSVTGLAKFVESAVDPCIKHFYNIILSVMGDQYEVVEHNRRAQMQLYVIAKKSLIPFISQVEKNAENTGFMHVFPNKGGLLVSLNIDGTSLAFVSCHLAAHEGVAKCQLRNDSIKEILDGARCKDKRYDIFAQCHHIFWMGDMNYRLTFNTKSVPVETHHRQHDKNHNDKHHDKSHNQAPPSPRSSIRVFGSENMIPDDENDMESSGARGSYSSPGGSPRNQQQRMSTESNMYADMEDKESDDEADFGVDLTPSQGKKKKTALREAEMNKLYRLIYDENWSELLKLDELNRELAAGRVLYGFTALQPSWPPTFKRLRHIGINRAIYDNDGPSEYDRIWDIAYHDCLSLGPKGEKANKQASVDPDDMIFSMSNPTSETALTTTDISLSENMSEIAYNSITNYYHKKRLPSYTDRILFKSWDSYADNLVNTSFESAEDVLSSDHKPVRASFTLTTTLGIKNINIFYDEKKSQSRFFGSKSSEPMMSVNSPSSNGNSYMRRQSSTSMNESVATKYQSSLIHNIINLDSTYAALESSIESLHMKVVSKMRFELYNLHCINLAEMDSTLSGGKSDPYIILSADPTVLGYNPRYDKDDGMMSCSCISGHASKVHEVVSPIVYHNLNPVWEDHLSLTVLSFDVHGLVDNLNFMLSVWDHDRFNDDDIIGTCTISLKEMWPKLTKQRADDRKYYFDKQLVNKGIVMGRIKGVIIVPDRSIDYFIQENNACYTQAMILDEAHGNGHRHRPPMKQGSYGSIGTPSPRANSRGANMDRSASNMHDSMGSESESKCVIM